MNLSPSDGVLLLGALVLGAAVSIFMVNAFRGVVVNHEPTLVSAQGGPSVLLRLIASMGFGATALTMGLIMAGSFSAVAAYALVLACVALGGAAAIPGVVLMLRAWPRFIDWLQPPRSPGPPRPWVAGAALTIVGFVGVAVLVPAVVLHSS